MSSCQSRRSAVRPRFARMARRVLFACIVLVGLAALFLAVNPGPFAGLDRCGTALAEAASMAPADDTHAGAGLTRVGPFALGPLLGAGGMGVVYRATAADGTPAAVKVLSPTQDAQVLRRFEREAQLRIDH